MNKPEQTILIQSADAASSIPVRTLWGANMGVSAAHEVVSNHDLALRGFRRGDDEFEKDSHANLSRKPSNVREAVHARQRD